MCGIAGWTSEVPKTFGFNILNKASERGCDGYGVLKVDSGSITKKAKRFNNHDYIKDFNNFAILAHFRLHTIINTSNDESYLQPLKYKDCYISHNGYINNKNIQNESDSFVLLKSIYKENFNISKTVKKLNINQIALVVYNSKNCTFYLYRDQMPLYAWKKTGVKKRAFCSKKVNKSFKLIPEREVIKFKNGW